MPKLLIVTSAFNAENTINETLKSTKLLCDKNSNIVHLVKDALSNDKTIEIIKKYPHAKLVSSSDKGIFDGFNQGASFTNWDFIYYLNADDILTKTGVECLNWISNHGDKNSVYCYSIVVIKSNKKKVFYNSKKITLFKILTGYMPPHPGMVTGKNAFKKFDIELKISSDYKFFLEIWNNKKNIFYFYKEIILEMKAGGNSQNYKGRFLSFYEDGKILSNYYGLFFGYTISLLKKIRGFVKWYLI
jgi:glycosyltransferase involved in cell wall biosynthesis